MKDSEIEAFLRKAVASEPHDDDPEVRALLVPPPKARMEAIVSAATKRVATMKTNRHTRFALAALFASVAAAALLLFLLRPRAPRAPEYELEIASNQQTTRAEPSPGSPGPTRAHLHAGASLELIARPAVRATGPVAVTAALVRHGQVTPWAPPMEIDEGGSVRIQGPIEKLFPEPKGTYTIVLAIGPKDRLPKTLEANPQPRDHPALRILRAEIDLD